MQYACADYVARLEASHIAISMSRPANPYDNAKAESFMKTLKTEEVNGKEYLNLEDARAHIGAFLDNVYNARRLHSPLGYKPPDGSKPNSTGSNRNNVINDKRCRQIRLVSHSRGAVH